LLEAAAKCNYAWVVLTDNILELISAAGGNSGLSCSERKKKTRENRSYFCFKINLGGAHLLQCQICVSK